MLRNIELKFNGILMFLVGLLIKGDSFSSISAIVSSTDFYLYIKLFDAILKGELWLVGEFKFKDLKL